MGCRFESCWDRQKFFSALPPNGLRKPEADRLACDAWNMRMLGFQGPSQPSPALGDAINAGYLYLEVKCLGCNTHQTVALDIARRPKATPIHELERYMRCEERKGRPFRRSHLVTLRPTKISASDPASSWWPGAVNSPEIIWQKRENSHATRSFVGLGRNVEGCPGCL